MKKDFIFKHLNLVIFLILVVWNLGLQNWREPNKMIQSDVAYYYQYLPTAFIQHDIACTFLEHRYKLYPRMQPFPTSDGKYCSKMSMGTAYMYAPFFFTAHLLAEPLGFVADGYSMIYPLLISLGTLVYLFFGLYFLKKVLIRNFSQKVVALTLLTIVFGTNLLYYALHEAMMSHAFSFSLIALFLFLVDKWYQQKKLLHALLLGIVGGVIILIRPTNALLAIYFILYGIRNLNDVKLRLYEFTKYLPHLLLILLMVFIVWVPQFLYWKYVSGQYWFYSYGGESFQFSFEKIVKGLFSFRKGWLVYTPIMILAFIGLGISFKRKVEFSWAITIFIILFIGVTFSWWCWWYGGGLSARPMVDILSVMALPLAVFITWVIKQTSIFRIVLFSVLVLFSLRSLHHVIQYHYGALHYDSATKASYFDSFFRIYPSKTYWVLLEKPDYEGAKLLGKESQVK